MNYVGPGTHIINNVHNSIKPKSRTDWVATKHDIDYLRPGHFNAFKADLKAIRKSDWSPEGIAMKLGLSFRSMLDLIYLSNPLMWGFHPLTDFNVPALENSVENESLILDLENHATSWDLEFETPAESWGFLPL